MNKCQKCVFGLDPVPDHQYCTHRYTWILDQHNSTQTKKVKSIISVISYITRVHHLITVLMLLSQRSRDPDSLLLHWPQREGDCAIAGAAAADGDNADTWEGHTCTQTRSSRRESTRIRTHHHLSTPRPVLAPQILQRERSYRSESMHSTYPVSSEARPRALCLHTSKEREVAEFRENQQQQPLHTLRCHLKEQGKIHQLSHWWTVAMQSLWLYTDQNISRWTEGVHAKLTPLVWEKNILQPLVYHGVDFLESVQRSDINKWAI